MTELDLCVSVVLHVFSVHRLMLYIYRGFYIQLPFSSLFCPLLASSPQLPVSSPCFLSYFLSPLIISFLLQVISLFLSCPLVFLSSPCFLTLSLPSSPLSSHFLFSPFSLLCSILFSSAFLHVVTCWL